MVQEIRMPKVAQDMQEALIIAWVAKQGQQIAQGDVLFELETDKATMEVESITSGTLQKIVIQAGNIAQVQQIVGYLADSKEELQTHLKK